MHVEQVEIYSDKTNSAVMRHPGRKFPGVLIQGDTLSAICANVDDVCTKAKDKLDAQTFKELIGLREGLHDFLIHYKVVLDEH